jgi:malate:Na+ symporter
VAAGLVLIAVGLALAQINRRIPKIPTLGLDTVIVIFAPSYLVYTGWIPLVTLSDAKRVFDATHAIELFIAVVITGSVLSIDRRGLATGLGKMMVPLGAGSIAAGLVGTLVGTALGLTSQDAFFRIVTPMLGGGLTAGALPLSIGYATRFATPQGEELASLLPAVILGNLAAIVVAGMLGLTARERPSRPSKTVRAFRGLTSEPGEVPGADMAHMAHMADRAHGRTYGLATGALVMVSLYGAGFFASRAFTWPAPLVVLVIAAALQMTDALPPAVRSGVLVVYRFCITTFTYPLLFAVGLLQTPWGRLMDGFAPVNLLTVLSVALTLAVSGYWFSTWCGLDPVDGALVTVTRAAMGGTGDIAILSAARRFELMPFAQIATRVGGAATVALVLSIL